MTTASKSIGLENVEAPLETHKGKSCILAIGINQYTHCPPLYNAVNDAQQMVNLLTSKYQFDHTEVITLFDGDATRRNIFLHLENLARKITPEDNLLIYFSGHGTYKDIIDEGFWVPVDAYLDDQSSFIPNSSIIKYLKAIKAYHIIIISDACFSGALFTEKFVSVQERQENIPSRWLMTSGRNEVVSDGKPGQHSPFADSLLLHLQSNREEVLPITRLSNSILEDVGGNSVQLPRCEPLRDVGHRGGEFMFRVKGSVAAAPKKERKVEEEQWNDYIEETAWEKMKVLLAHRNSKIAALVLMLLAAGFVIWKEAINHTVKPSSQVRTYKVYLDAGAGLLIVRDKNNLYGYARQSDSALSIPCKYELAYPFKDGLAMVKRQGKYGWIRPDSSTAIVEKYNYAEEFVNGQARVAEAGDTFLINTKGERFKSAGEEVNSHAGGESKQTDHTGTKPPQTQPEKPYKAKTCEITLILDAEWADAEILVDGKEAAIIEPGISIKKISLSSKPGNQTISLVLPGGKTCEVKRVIQSDTTISFNCKKS